MAIDTMSSEKESTKESESPPSSPSATSPTSETASEPGKMFVGGLSWQTEKEQLQEYFEKFGDLGECIVMKDPVTKRSRGFGFVTFKDPKTVEKVLTGGPHLLAEKTIDPKIAVPRKQLVTRTKKIFVGGLSASTTEEDVKAFFETFGKVTECMLMIDKQTQRHRGFGFVTFETEDIVEQVCKAHFHEINSKMVETKKAQPRDVMFPAPTGRGRGQLRPFGGSYPPFYPNNWLAGFTYPLAQRGRGGRAMRFPAPFGPVAGYFPFASTGNDQRVRSGMPFFDSWVQGMRPMMGDRSGMATMVDQYDYNGYHGYNASSTGRFPTPLSPTAPASQNHLPGDGNHTMSGQSNAMGPGGAITPVYMGPAAVTTAYGLPVSTSTHVANGLTPMGMAPPASSPGYDNQTGYSLPTPPYVQNGHSYQ